MEFNKFQRILWTINGVFIFLLCLFLGYKSVENLFRPSYRNPSPEIVVGTKLEKAKSEGLILQRLVYDNPIKVANANGYILPVKIKTYENPERALYALDSDVLRVEMSNTVNIIFLDDDLEVKRSLLSRKAFISDFRYSVPGRTNYGEYDGEVAGDSIRNNISYEIAFDDSNNDGVLNRFDAKDLYISAVDGSDFTQVTRDLDISDYKFISQNKILISYTKRDDTVEQEHRKQYLALYFVDKKELGELSSLGKELGELEKLITQ